MDVKSSVYDRVNGYQVRDGKELINWILRRHSGVQDVIMDVGCGSGNLTKLLGESIPHNRLLALDIDPNMVQFAEENYSDANTKYTVQDIAQTWEKIHPKIRDLENSVDLIFLNYTLHWVQDVDTAFENLFKLLKPGGAIYFTVAAHRLNHRSLKMDSAVAQRSKICRSLKGVGFHDVSVQPKQEDWEYDSPKDFQETLKLIRDYYFRFMTPETGNELRSELEDFVYRIYSVQTGGDLPEKFDLEQRTIFYATFFGRAQK